MEFVACKECGNKISVIGVRACRHCMAFVACKECGEKISVKADLCPQCGHPDPVHSMHGIVPMLIILSILAGIRYYFPEWF